MEPGYFPGWPALNSDFINWALNLANVSPRSKRHIERDIEIYKRAINEKRPLQEISTRFGITEKHTRTVMLNIKKALESRTRKTAS